jgi:hypothetical protein
MTYCFKAPYNLVAALPAGHVLFHVVVVTTGLRVPGTLVGQDDPHDCEREE